MLPSNRTQLEVSSDLVRKCRGSLEFGTMDSNELGCVNRNELSYRHCVIAAEVHRQIVDCSDMHWALALNTQPPKRALQRIVTSVCCTNDHVTMTDNKLHFTARLDVHCHRSRLEYCIHACTSFPTGGGTFCPLIIGEGLHISDRLNFTVGLVAQEEDCMLDSVSADGPPR